MKFFDFMESHFVSNNIKCQTMEVNGSGFSPWLNAEVKAAHWLIAVQRKFYICLQVFRLAFGFSFTKIGLLEAPVPAKAMLEEYTATAKAKIAAAQERQRNDKLREQGRGLEASDQIPDLKPPVAN